MLIGKRVGEYIDPIVLAICNAIVFILKVGVFLSIVIGCVSVPIAAVKYLFFG